MKYLYDLLVRTLKVVKKYLATDETSNDMYWRMSYAWEKSLKVILSCTNLEELRTAGIYVKGFNSVYGDEFPFEYTLLLTEYNCKLKELKIDNKIDDIHFISEVASIDENTKVEVA